MEDWAQLQAAWLYSHQALRRLDENSITYIVLAEEAESVEMYDAVLEIETDGTWNWKQTRRFTSGEATNRIRV